MYIYVFKLLLVEPMITHLHMFFYKKHLAELLPDVKKHLKNILL